MEYDFSRAKDEEDASTKNVNSENYIVSNVYGVKRKRGNVFLFFFCLNSIKLII